MTRPIIVPPRATLAFLFSWLTLLALAFLLGLHLA